VSVFGKFRRCRLPAFMLALFSLACTAAGPAYSAEVEVYAAVDSFVWKEFIDGTRLLKESGTLTGLGVSFRKDFADRLVLDASAEIFGGRVGYDGGTQSGVPATSTVDYLGLKLKGDAGKRFSVAGPFTLEPFAGLGYRTWRRGIRNGTTPSGQQVQGYTEQWTTLYARLGARGGMDIPQARSVFLEVGAKLPLYNENTAYFSREGVGPNVTMHPGWDWSLFAEAGIRMDRIKASVFYDGMRFARSADVAVPGGRIFQPRSTADIYGVKLGVLF
jgi:autotransporter-like protein